MSIVRAKGRESLRSVQNGNAVTRAQLARMADSEHVITKHHARRAMARSAISLKASPEDLREVLSALGIMPASKRGLQQSIRMSSQRQIEGR